MQTTLSIIKADIGSIGGHLKPSQSIIKRVKEHIIRTDLVLDARFFFTGDDIAILIAHNKGRNNKEIHKLCWDAFQAGTEVAKEQGLYGAGQDLLAESFSGNIKGAGPAIAELEFEERPNESFAIFMADKTDPGAYNLPLYLGFLDPMHNSGLVLSEEMSKGFKIIIMDVDYLSGDKIIELNSPEDLYSIATLLRDLEKFVVEEVYARSTGEQCASVSTTRLRNIAGKYVGKDDPVMIVRVQKDFPSIGEILSPFRLAPYVAGFMRGSHTGPLMPVKLNTPVSFFDGPPLVSGAGLCVHNGKFTEAVDLFDNPFWDYIRNKASEKAVAIREQGFFGSAMLPMSELEYGGVKKKLEELEKKFKIREKKI